MRWGIKKHWKGGGSKTKDGILNQKSVKSSEKDLLREGIICYLKIILYSRCQQLAIRVRPFHEFQSHCHFGTILFN